MNKIDKAIGDTYLAMQEDRENMVFPEHTKRDLRRHLDAHKHHLDSAMGHEHKAKALQGSPAWEGEHEYHTVSGAFHRQQAGEHISTYHLLKTTAYKIEKEKQDKK